jgi:hypothetical protein
MLTSSAGGITYRRVPLFWQLNDLVLYISFMRNNGSRRYLPSLVGLLP